MPAAVGAVRGQRRMVGHIGAGLQPELCHEAAGVGRTVGGQASEGGALRPDRPTGPCDVSRQEVDHPSGPWPSLIRVAAQGAAEDIGAGCRAVSSIATLLGASVCRRLCRVARPCHAFFGLRAAIIGSEPLPIPSKTAPETLSDARSCHASPLVDTRTPPESTPSSSQPCQVGNLGFAPLSDLWAVDWPGRSVEWTKRRQHEWESEGNYGTPPSPFHPLLTFAPRPGGRCAGRRVRAKSLEAPVAPVRAYELAQGASQV